MKRQKILIIFFVLLLIIVSVGCKENSENKTESIVDMEFSENISESSLEISVETKEEISEKEYTYESITDIVTSEITTNEITTKSDNSIIKEELSDDTLQSDMPIIKYDNYEQNSSVTTDESTEYEEVTTTKSVIELPFVPVG